MIEFLYFTLGILFVQFILPILDGISALILSWLEVGKGKASLFVAKYNHEITDLREDSGNEKTNIIGFQLPTEEEYDEDEEEEDE